MSPIGHHITVQLFALAALHRLSAEEGGLAWLSSGGQALYHYLLADGDLTLPALSLLVWLGLSFGARAPDQLELFKWMMGRRFSLIPHRTLTHWGLFWLAACYGAAWLLGVSGGQRAEGLVAILFGYTLGGVIHLFFDIMTPAGIPLLTPFARRTSLNVFRSGAITEYLILIGCIGITVMIWRL
jgi:inner membrane protein